MVARAWFGSAMRCRLLALVVLAGVFLLGAALPAFAAAHFSVSPDDPGDYIWAREFTPHALVTVRMDDPDNGVSWDYTYTPTADENGDFELGPVDDFHEGWTIELDDETNTKRPHGHLLGLRRV